MRFLSMLVTGAFWGLVTCTAASIVTYLAGYVLGWGIGIAFPLV